MNWKFIFIDFSTICTLVIVKCHHLVFYSVAIFTEKLFLGIKTKIKILTKKLVKSKPKLSSKEICIAKKKSKQCLARYQISHTVAFYFLPALSTTYKSYICTNISKQCHIFFHEIFFFF